MTHFSPRFGPFFVEPIVAGLDPLTYEPYICNMDLIGCITEPTDFVAGDKRVETQDRAPGSIPII